MSNIVANFKKARQKTNMSQAEISDKMGISTRTYQRIEANPENLSILDLKKYATLFDVDLATILDDNKSLSITGNDNVTLNGENNSIDKSFNMRKKKRKNLKQEETTETVSIPYFQDTYAAAGHGAINYDDMPHPMSFDKTFLQRQFGIVSFENLHIINAIGNSMEPTLKEGELLLVNPFENENMHIKDGGIYVITTANGTLVKRVHFNPISGEVTLKSDNKDHKDMPITKAEFENCRIVGRVVGHFDRI